MRIPTLKQLQYFLALTETGHFGRAADRCFVSQSAFSNAIRELETNLGTQLVDRTNRNVTITATGQEIAVQARLVIRDVDSLVEIARGLDEPLTGELRLGVIPTIAPFLLPGALPKLRREYPKLELLLAEDQTDRIYHRLMEGDLDVLLLALPWQMHGVRRDAPVQRQVLSRLPRRNDPRRPRKLPLQSPGFRQHPVTRGWPLPARTRTRGVQAPGHTKGPPLWRKQPADIDRNGRRGPRH